MSENQRVELLDLRIREITEEVVGEINSEQRVVATLSSLHRVAEDTRLELVSKRENIRLLERKLAVFYALKVVEELPEATLAERYYRLSELLNIRGVTLDSIRPFELSYILDSTVGEAYLNVFQATEHSNTSDTTDD